MDFEQLLASSQRKEEHSNWWLHRVYSKRVGKSPFLGDLTRTYSFGCSATAGPPVECEQKKNICDLITSKSPKFRAF